MTMCIVFVSVVLYLPFCTLYKIVSKVFRRDIRRDITRIRDLKQARTATAVNKQLNFTAKNKPHTTNYIYCIFEAYFMIKSV